MHESKPRVGFVGPLLLLGLGILFLLNNLGLTEIDIWRMIFQLWPLILIALGIDILLGRRSTWASLLSVLLIAGVFLGGFLLYQSSSTQQPLDALELEVPLTKAASAEFRLNPPIGVVRVSDTIESELLLNGFVNGWPEDHIRETVQTQGNKVLYTLGSREFSGVFFPMIFPGTSPRWEIQATRDLPMILDLEFGVGDAQLDLEQLQLTDLNLEMGVGRMEVTLPAFGDYRASIEGGVGLLIIEIPTDANVQIEVDRGLVAIQAPPEFRIREGAYGYSTRDATATIELFVSLGVGNILFREMSP